MDILKFNKNKIFKKFLNFYSYKILIKFTNKNIYCFIFSFFKFNIISSVSTINIILKNYIILNFGKAVNANKFEFLAKLISIIILNLNINLKLKNYKLKNNSKNIKIFFNYLKKFVYF